MPRWITRLPVVVAVSAALIGIYVFAVFAVAHCTLDEASKLGDALSPAVGLTSIVALLVALTSVRLQSDALAHQKEEATKAAASQKQAAEQNADAIRATIRYQETRPLREVYRDWFASAERYVGAVRDYADYITENATAARHHREDRRRPAEAALMALRQVDWMADLVDPDKTRATARGQVVDSAPLEPAGPDTPQNQRDNVTNILKWHEERSIEMLVIQASLKKTFGLPTKR